MKEANSISQFFSEVDCHFQCYNMGRLIHAIDKQRLIDFEQNNTFWQSPFLQHAWIAIVFWQKSIHKNEPVADHYVWFLKLPLDEQAKLNLAARDDFLRRLFEALGNYLADAQQNKHQSTTAKLQSLESALKDNPYGFQPKDEQMANFHAIVQQQFSLPASSYYQATQKYLSGQNGFEQWSQLGFQGIADYCARLHETFGDKSNEQLIIDNIEQLPFSPFQALALCLENQVISSQLTQVIYKKLQNQLNKVSTNKPLEFIANCVAIIRASAQSADQSLQIKILDNILNSNVGTDIEILATIAGRCWTQLIHPELLSAFLEALANSSIINQELTQTPEQEALQQQGAFNTILADLMFIPGMRSHILERFRATERSEQLTKSIGNFFNQDFSRK